MYAVRLRPRGACLLLLALLLCGVSALGAAPTASAHASLVSISPTAGQRLSQPPAKVSLLFDDTISTRFATLRVSDPSGNIVSAATPTVSGRTLSNAVTGRALTSGTYRVVWRVVSDDGHPVSGASSFILDMGRIAGSGSGSASGSGSGSASSGPTPTGPGVGSATPLGSSPVSPTATSSPTAAASTGSSSSGWGGIAAYLGVAVVVLVAALGLARRRRMP